jgi:hypothetical protein
LKDYCFLILFLNFYTTKNITHIYILEKGPKCIFLGYELYNFLNFVFQLLHSQKYYLYIYTRGGTKMYIFLYELYIFSHYWFWINIVHYKKYYSYIYWRRDQNVNFWGLNYIFFLITFFLNFIFIFLHHKKYYPYIYRRRDQNVYFWGMNYIFYIIVQNVNNMGWIILF